jgi:hypothetical protein
MSVASWRKSLLPRRSEFADLGAWRRPNKIELVHNKVIVAFGFLVRYATMLAFGWWLVLNMPSISDVPLGQLTLASIFNVVARWTMVVGLACWAFRPGAKSYKAWAYVGVIEAVILLYLARQ